MAAEIPGSVNTFQDNWRFCIRCLGLFWNGRSDNGHCPHPDGGAHQAVSWNFFLPANSNDFTTQDPGRTVGP